MINSLLLYSSSTFILSFNCLIHRASIVNKWTSPCHVALRNSINPKYWTTCCQMFGNCPLLSVDVFTKADLEMSRCCLDIACLAVRTIEFVNQSAFHCIIYRFFKWRHNGSQFPQSEDCSDWYTNFPQIIVISFWTLHPFFQTSS